MEITEVRIYPVDESVLRAQVTITIDNGLVVRDLKVIRGPDGHFVDCHTNYETAIVGKLLRRSLTQHEQR
jgi:Uncharacterized protein, involved in the regulation of septum location